MQTLRLPRSLALRAALLSAALCALPLLAGCGLLAPRPIPPREAPLTPVIPLPSTPGGITLFFTDPSAPGAAKGAGGPDEELVAAIDAAQTSVDVAIYSISLEPVAEALLRAAQRGAAVRLVVEHDNLNRRVPQWLVDQGLPVVADRGEGRMHNKFLILDGREVWTGSMNFTASGVYNDHNHLVRLRSEQAAQNYTVEFEEMFLEGQFGKGGSSDTPYPTLDIAGRVVEVYFAPEDGVEARLLELIASARSSLTVLAFSFTSDPLADALLARAAEGIPVRAVLDEEQALSNTGGDFARLKAGGVTLRLDGSPGQMHHKVLIVDGEWVACGSYNFTRSAEMRNDENLLLIHDPALAELFLEEFEYLYAQGKR